MDFTCGDEDADRLAAELADGLAAGKWYADYSTDTVKYVVFALRIFRFLRADDRGRSEAIAHARSVGVPEAQLDWPV
jgi:hypothetical protein